jgi:Ran-binding protein 3
MRSDGVLKVLLNCYLLPGMTCLVSDKFVRFIAIEEGKLLTYVFKLGSTKAAIELGEAIRQNIPTE